MNNTFEATKLACEGGGEITATRKAIKTASIQIEFQVQRGHLKKQPLSHQNPLQ